MYVSSYPHVALTWAGRLTRRTGQRWEVRVDVDGRRYIIGRIVAGGLFNKLPLLEAR